MGEWISVKDRLPEKGVDVLAFNRRGKGKAWEIDKAFWNGFAFQRTNRKPNLRHVTNWMPLPAPPVD